MNKKNTEGYGNNSKHSKFYSTTKPFQKVSLEKSFALLAIVSISFFITNVSSI